MTNVRRLQISGLAVLGLVLGLGIFSGCKKSATEPAQDRRTASAGEASSYVFYPPAPDVPRLQFLTSFTESDDLGSGSQKKVGKFERFVLGEEPKVVDGILKPYGMAMSEGKLYVCDVQKRVVEVLDLEARTFGYLSKERRMTNPVNLCIVNDIKYVADPTAGQIFVFGRDNELKTILGSDEDLEPIDVEVRGQNCYVTDKKSNQVVVINIATGRVVQRVGKAGDGLGQFVLIGDLGIDQNNNLYVTDKLLGRITKFNTKGLFQKSIGQAGDSIHHFVRPKGIDVDRAGRIWVVDAAPEVAKVYDAEGRLLLYFGFPGEKPGSMNLPASIVIDYDHIQYFREFLAEGAEPEFLVFVSNQYGEKINVYAYGDFPVQAQAITQARERAAAEALALQDTMPSEPESPPTGQEAAAPTAPQTVASDDQRMQKIANLYYKSMHLYRSGQYKDARPGFVAVLNSRMIPEPMAQTIQLILSDIDKRLAPGSSKPQVR